MVVVLKILLSASLIFCVLFNPAAHTLKHVLLDEPRYHGFGAVDLVHAKISANDTLLYTDDRFAPPFLDLVTKTYDGTGSVSAYWIFPPLMGGRELEKRTVMDFVCRIRQDEGGTVVWAVTKNLVVSVAHPVPWTQVCLTRRA